MLSIFIGLIVVLLVVLFWQAQTRAKEKALQYSREFCDKSDVQLLDETVCLTRYYPKKKLGGGVCLFRRYQFDYLWHDHKRLKGYLDMQGLRLQNIELTIESERHEEGRQGQKTSNNVVNFSDYRNRKADNDE